MARGPTPVRAVIFDGDFAAVLDDTNSDYHEIELIMYQRAGQRWLAIYSEDDVAIPAAGDTYPVRWCVALVGGGYVWTFGREYPGTSVLLSYNGEPVEVVADAQGWWAFIRETTAQVPEVLGQID